MAYHNSGEQPAANIALKRRRAVLLIAGIAWAAFLFSFSLISYDTARGWDCADFSFKTLYGFVSPAAAADGVEGSGGMRAYIASFTIANLLMALSPVFLTRATAHPQARASATVLLIFILATLDVCSWLVFAAWHHEAPELGVGYFVWAGAFLLLSTSLLLPAGRAADGRAASRPQAAALGAQTKV